MPGLSKLRELLPLPLRLIESKSTGFGVLRSSSKEDVFSDRLSEDAGDAGVAGACSVSVSIACVDCLVKKQIRRHAHQKHKTQNTYNKSNP